MGHIIAFTASKREESISTELVHLAAQTARSMGHTVEFFDLTDAEIVCCAGCGYCRTHDGCTRKDRLAKLYPKLVACDGIIFGTPIYFSGIAGQTKIWLDRLYPMMDSNFVPRHPGKKVLAIYAQGDGNEKAFLPAIASVNYIFRLCGWELLSSIVCPGTSEPGFQVSEHIAGKVVTAAEQF